MCHKIIPIDSIITGDRIRKDLGDIQSLANSIREVGLISNIVVNEECKLLAGERRLSACKLLGWTEVEVSIINTADAEKELTVEIAENNLRKSFTNEELVNAGISLERIEKIKAEERMKAGKADPELNLSQGKKDRAPQVRDIVATKLGISATQYERMKFIVQHKDEIPKDDYEDWNNRRISTNKMFTDLKKLLTPITEKVKTKTITVEKSPQDYEKLNNKITTLSVEIVKLTEENEKLSSATNESVPSDYEELKTKVTTLTNENKTLQTMIKDKEEEIEYLLNEETDSEELDFLREKYDEANQKIVSYEEEITRLRNHRDPGIREADTAYDFWVKANTYVKNTLAPFHYDEIVTNNLNNSTGKYIMEACSLLIEAATDILRRFETQDVIVVN